MAGPWLYSISRQRTSPPLRSNGSSRTQWALRIDSTLAKSGNASLMPSSVCRVWEIHAPWVKKNRSVCSSPRAAHSWIASTPRCPTASFDSAPYFISPPRNSAQDR